MDSIRFEYRPTIKKIYWFLVVITIIFLLVLLRINLAKLATETYIFTTIKLVIALIVPLSILFRLHFIIRPYIFSKYKLEKNLLFVKFKKKEKKVNLDHVTHLKFTLFSPRFFGGFKIKLDDGSSYRFLSLLQNNHKVVEYLFVNKPSLKSEAKYSKYIKTSKTVLVSWKRILLRLKQWPWLLIKYFLLPGIFYFYTYKNISLGNNASFSETEKLVLLYVSFFIINLVIAIVYNHFEEMILNSRISEKTDEELSSWDFSTEKIIFYCSQVFFYISTAVTLYIYSKSIIHIF